MFNSFGVLIYYLFHALLCMVLHFSVKLRNIPSFLRRKNLKKSLKSNNDNNNNDQQ